MRFFLFVLILFISISVASQDKSLAVGVFGSSEVNNYFFEETPTNRDYDYNSLIGYSFGLNVKYFISDDIIIESGIGIAHEGFNYFYNFNNPNPNINVISPIKTEVKVNYLRVPVKSGTKVFKIWKLDFRPSLAAIFDFNISEKENTFLDNGTAAETDFIRTEINKFLLSLGLDFGVEFHKEDYSIVLTPFIYKRLKALNEDLMETGRFSYGVNIGAYIKI